MRDDGESGYLWTFPVYVFVANVNLTSLPASELEMQFSTQELTPGGEQMLTIFCDLDWAIEHQNRYLSNPALRRVALKEPRALLGFLLYAQRFVTRLVLDTNPDNRLGHVMEIEEIIQDLARRIQE